MSGDHLTDLETSWTTIRNAHSPGPAGQAAMSELIGRYHDAVERYLRLKLRDQNLADEVFQEFWTKLLTHKLAGADNNKGRFRDYLRTVLHRLIIDHFRTKKQVPCPPATCSTPPGPTRTTTGSGARRSSSESGRASRRTRPTRPKNRYATVLHLRVNNPDAPIEEIAKQMADQVGTPVSPEAFRKTLQRARAKFLELLIQELRQTIHPADPEDIEAEIYDLGWAISTAGTPAKIAFDPSINPQFPHPRPRGIPTSHEAVTGGIQKLSAPTLDCAPAKVKVDCGRRLGNVTSQKQFHPESSREDDRPIEPNGFRQHDSQPIGEAMLVLSRKKNESIIINDDITITVVEIRGDKVRLGIEAPKTVTVHRQEVYDAIQNQEKRSGTNAPAAVPDSGLS